MKTLKKISICLLAIISLTLVSCMQEEKPKEEKQQTGPQHAKDVWVKNWVRKYAFEYYRPINDKFDDMYVNHLQSKDGSVTYNDVLYYFWCDKYDWSNKYSDHFEDDLELVNFRAFDNVYYNGVEEYQNYVLKKLGLDKKYERDYGTYGTYLNPGKTSMEERTRRNEMARNLANPQQIVSDLLQLKEKQMKLYEEQTLNLIEVFEWRPGTVVSDNYTEYYVTYEFLSKVINTRYALVSLTEFKNGRYEIRLLKKAKVISELYQ
jgi:hypothetical protein